MLIVHELMLIAVVVQGGFSFLVLVVLNVEDELAVGTRDIPEQKL